MSTKVEKQFQQADEPVNVQTILMRSQISELKQRTGKTNIKEMVAFAVKAYLAGCK